MFGHEKTFTNILNINLERKMCVCENLMMTEWKENHVSTSKWMERKVNLFGMVEELWWDSAVEADTKFVNGTAGMGEFWENFYKLNF